MASPNQLIEQDSRTSSFGRKRGFDEAAISDSNVISINNSDDEFEQAWKRARRSEKPMDATRKSDIVAKHHEIITIEESPENSPARKDGASTIAVEDRYQNGHNGGQAVSALPPHISWNRGVQSGLRISFGNQKTVLELQAKTPSTSTQNQSQEDGPAPVLPEWPIKKAPDQKSPSHAQFNGRVPPVQKVRKKSKLKKKKQESNSPSAKTPKTHNTEQSKPDRKQRAQARPERRQSGFQMNKVKYVYPKLLDENNQEMVLKLEHFKLENFTQIFLPAFLEENKALLKKMANDTPIRAFGAFIASLTNYGGYSIPLKRRIRKEIRGTKEFCAWQITQALKSHKLEKEIQEMEPGEERERVEKEALSFIALAKDSSNNPANENMILQGEQRTNLENDDDNIMDWDEYTDTDSEEGLDEAADMLMDGGWESPGHISSSLDDLVDDRISHSQNNVLQPPDQILPIEGPEPQTATTSECFQSSEQLMDIVHTPAPNSPIPDMKFPPSPAPQDITASTEISNHTKVHLGNPATSIENHDATDEIHIPNQLDATREMEVDPAEVELIRRYNPGSEKFAFVPQCLSCADIGHKASECPLLICSTCGLVGVHFTGGCPQTQRCARCFQRGHDATACQERLQASPDERPGCDLCTSNKHLTAHCDLLWRSYKPYSIKIKLLVQYVPIHCYCCGREGHYGPECGVRHGKRNSGSYTWTKDNWTQYIDPKSNQHAISAGKDSLPIPMRPKRDFTIKGQARQNAANHDDSTEGDDTPFIGRRVTKAIPLAPLGKQQIQFKKFGNESQHVSGSDLTAPTPNSRQPSTRFSQRDFPENQRNESDRLRGHLGRHDRERSISPLQRHSPDRYESRPRDDYHRRGGSRAYDYRDTAHKAGNRVQGGPGNARGKPSERRGRGGRGRGTRLGNSIR
jgi:hypothetical protein